MGKRKTAKKPKKTSPSPNNYSPIVTIMGHVDHGKTTLLDSIRKSHLTSKEAGGITQHIGAYQITHKNQQITFIDTPGHAAFAKMRSRGAGVTDIVILVVAASEGVKPQTVESINHIKAAKVPFIVAINKIDLPNADPTHAKSELAKYDVIVEDFGGKIPSVEISAKTGKNIDQLLELIQLIKDIEGFTADPKTQLKATIIESHLDKNKVSVATAIVKSGTLKTGVSLFIDEDQFKVRNLTNDKGQAIKEALPSTPVEITGFKSTPLVGAIISTSPNKPTIEEDKPLPEIKMIDQEEDIEALLNDEEEQEERQNINIILKTDVAGTLEAIKTNLPEEVIIIKAGVGQVSDSDILLAASTRATVIAFNTKVSKSAQSLALNEKVPIKSYKIIYKLLEEIEKIILKILEPTIDEEELGVAEIVEIFEISDKKIAGCKVLSGVIKKTDTLHLKREDKIITDVKLKSLKQAKVDVDRVKAKSECGMIITPSSNFQKGDKLIAFKKISDDN